MSKVGAVLAGAVSLLATGCVPASVEEWSGGGPRDAGAEVGSDGTPEGSTRDAAVDAALRTRDGGRDAHALDAAPVVEAVVDAASAEPPPLPADAGFTNAPDAASVPSLADAGGTPLCATTGLLLCDDFESVLLVCPSEHPGKWSSCEQLGSAPDPMVVGGAAGTRGRVLVSSLGSGSEMRSARIALDLLLDVRNVHAAFDVFPQPATNALYTWGKLEQGAGHDVNDDPTHYSGVSLISREGKLALSVQRTYDLLKPDAEEVTEVTAMPSKWTRIELDVAFGATQIDVSLQLDGAAPMKFGPFARGTVTVDTLQFLLGVYSDGPGTASVLYDDVVVRADRQ